jgi:hypothetical protein
MEPGGASGADPAARGDARAAAGLPPAIRARWPRLRAASGFSVHQPGTHGGSVGWGSRPRRAGLPAGQRPTGGVGDGRVDAQPAAGRADPQGYAARRCAFGVRAGDAVAAAAGTRGLGAGSAAAAVVVYPRWGLLRQAGLGVAKPSARGGSGRCRASRSAKGRCIGIGVGRTSCSWPAGPCSGSPGTTCCTGRPGWWRRFGRRFCVRPFEEDVVCDAGNDASQTLGHQVVRRSASITMAPAAPTAMGQKGTGPASIPGPWVGGRVAGATAGISRNG